MAARAIALLLLGLQALPYGLALQVTPNSPCSALCVDSNDLDVSDPNSSNTRGTDITCEDRRYKGSAAGVKWQRCMSCLQNSTYHQGSESDQAWFLYNSRYNFDYCIFGFPNATDVGSSPCQTSTACGPLEKALQDGNLDPKNTSTYGYCSANGAVMTSAVYSKCLACVGASGDTTYIANALVALEAGCMQQPPPGKLIGLSDTIFSDHVVSIVDPSTVTQAPTPDNAPHMATSTIVIIVISAVVALALAAGFFYIRHRKRRARRSDGLTPLGRGNHRPKSSLSFRCQTHLSPRSPRFFPSEESIDEMSYSIPTSRHITTTKSKPWRPQSDAATFKNPSSISDILSQKPGLASTTTVEPLSRIQTSIPSPPASPRAALSSYTSKRGEPTPAQRRESGTLHSAVSSHSNENPFTTPTSTTQLIPPALPRYNPAEFGINTAARGVESPYYASPSSATSASPLLKQYAWSSMAGPQPGQQQREQMPPPPSKSPGLGLRKKDSGGVSPSGSPVESSQIQILFPGPPQRSRR